MAKYQISRKAGQDLEDIWNYTMTEWSESQADIYYRALIGSFEDIARHPALFDREYSGIHAGLYCHRCRKHLIFYTVNDSDEVVIWRVLHERVDIDSKFQ